MESENNTLRAKSEEKAENADDTPPATEIIQHHTKPAVVEHQENMSPVAQITGFIVPNASYMVAPASFIG